MASIKKHTAAAQAAAPLTVGLTLPIAVAETLSRPIRVLAYCLEFSNREIGILLGQARFSVQCRRQQSLVNLRFKLRK